MNEAETRAELIDPKLKACGWGVVEDAKVLRERDVCKITDGRIKVGGGRAKPLIADYILQYKGIKLAVVEAKSSLLPVGEGVAQAKMYAQKLKLKYTYATNGREIYQINMSGEEKLVDNYLSPQELWNEVYSDQNEWRNKFAAIPFEDRSGTWQPRYYQEIAVNNALEAIAQKKKRILLTLATGTGKTAIAFQIAWKLFHTRWNLTATNSSGYYVARRPRILFLADRNILADQAFNSFSAFQEDALVRIKPSGIKKTGSVPTNGSIFFSIFQTFMAGTDDDGQSKPYYEDYPEDYFDFIVIDECHRGGANDESNWRAILEYFAPAVQLGLTATPRRQDNVDTYKYFGAPVYIYSLKEGINDGFLTPFKVKRVQTTIDDYVYTSDDDVIEGEVEEGKVYYETDFNTKIEIMEREAHRVKTFMSEIDQREKSIVFCATQVHAAAVRDLVNQNKKSTNPHYCVRVTANDGEIGEQFLREFQDNEKSIPTILTTSQKLSTGVDARNIRNIILMRPVNQIVEFKQIIGRGTRLFDGKEFFTVFDFVNAYQRFSDPEWDGEPLEEEACSQCGEIPCSCVVTPPKPCAVCQKRPCICEKALPEACLVCGNSPCTCSRMVRVKLADGKEREIQHMISTMFYSADGNPISSAEFLENLFGELPNFFTSEDELRELWSHPMTRKALLNQLDEAGYSNDDLRTLQKLINAENSDLYDVLEYVANSNNKPLSREERAQQVKASIYASLNEKQQEFIDFVLTKYIETGVSELYQDKLPTLLIAKYQSLPDAMDYLGTVDSISSLFVGFQRHLYGGIGGL